MVSTDKNPYEILGVPENIDYVSLRKVYRTKIHEHLQRKISAINFRQICRAYETLSDFDKRKHYHTQKEWISEIPISNYTSQQLAAEPDLIDDLKKRLEKANLTQINAQDPLTGHTTLYSAARAGNVEAVKFLTEQGAEPDLPQRIQSTALHVASFYGHADVVRCLLESGADYRIKNSCGSTPEREAYDNTVRQIFIELKQIAYVRVAANELEWFLTSGLTEHQDTEYFAQRQTLLHCACKKGYDDLIHWLVEKQSANIDLVDFNGNSALHLAAFGGYTTIVKYLLDHGCNPTLKNRWGTTAEEEGSKHKEKVSNIFKQIREQNAFEMAQKGIDWWFYYYFDNKLKDDIDTYGISLLYYASRFGHYSVAKWLLENGANVNIQMINRPKSTPLHGAKYRGHFSLVELLLEYGADINIKNDYGVTVSDEKISTEVDENLSNKIQELLKQYQCYLKSDKLIDIHIYEDDGDEQEPKAKIKIAFEAVYKDLLEALSEISDEQFTYFSIAGRPLCFEHDTTVISAICCARHTSSKFIDIPIRLTGHKTSLNKNNFQLIHHDSKLDLDWLERQFPIQGKLYSFILKNPLKEKKNIKMDDLTFTFAENCISDDVHFKVTTLLPSVFRTFNLPGCICLFKIELDRDTTKLIELPVVSIHNKPEARLYTSVKSTSYWFTSDTRRTRLPTTCGIHALVFHVDVIPGKLIIPPDIFIAATLDQPLISRNKPIDCTCLTLRKQDTHTFPHIAYHGTNINAIRSILIDGLVIPGTVVSCGIRVNPPSNHFAREKTYFGVPDFAAAIFLSPSVYYSSDPVYAATFSNGNKQMIPVLECSVKSNSYETYRGTVRNYNIQPDDDVNALEWRIKDPANIEINAVLFITKIESITTSKKDRITKTT